jgi:hypothetical protein
MASAVVASHSSDFTQISSEKVGASIRTRKARTLVNVPALPMSLRKLNSNRRPQQG